MVKIKNEQQYEKALERVEELLRVVGNDTPESDKNFVELDLLSELVADYEEDNYPVCAPTLSESIRLRMAEMNIILGVAT